MPVIELDLRDLRSLLGEDVPLDRLVETIPSIGAEIESATDEMLRVEFFPNRPDLYSVEGVARALRRFMSLGEEGRAPEMSDSGIGLKVDASVNDVRPFIVCGVVRNVEMTDSLIRSLMDMQEKLHLTLGRKRRKVAIGVHDMRYVKPPFVYRGAAPDEVRFVPLGMTDEMNLREILQRHDKGKEFACVLDGAARYPIIEDSAGQVLSFPPIINGTVTEVKEDSRDLFLDVTGTDMRAVDAALNILAFALRERGGEVQSVQIKYPDRSILRPDLSPMEMRLDLGWASGIVGTAASTDDALRALGRMGHDASADGSFLIVKIPPYRSDILHPIDLVEDLAIGLGYSNLGGVLPHEYGSGSLRQIDAFSDLAANALVGHGYMEVTTLTLSSRREQALAPGFDESKLTTIANPATEEDDCLRMSLIPSLLSVLRGNKHRRLPQRLFEIGDAVISKSNVRLCAGVSMHPDSGFSEAKSMMLAMARDLALGTPVLRRDSKAAFMDGRCAAVVVGGIDVGTIGELKPDVIVQYELSNPVVAFELDLGALITLISKKDITPK